MLGARIRLVRNLRDGHVQLILRGVRELGRVVRQHRPAVRRRGQIVRFTHGRRDCIRTPPDVVVGDCDLDGIRRTPSRPRASYLAPFGFGSLIF